MIAWIKNMLEASKRIADAKQHKQGYDCAAGLLLSGSQTPIQVEATYYAGFSINNRSTPFDKGMMAATDDYCVLAKQDGRVNPI